MHSEPWALTGHDPHTRAEPLVGKSKGIILPTITINPHRRIDLDLITRWNRILLRNITNSLTNQLPQELQVGTREPGRSSTDKSSHPLATRRKMVVPQPHRIFWKRTQSRTRRPPEPKLQTPEEVEAEAARVLMGNPTPQNQPKGRALRRRITLLLHNLFQFRLSLHSHNLSQHHQYHHQP